MSYITIGMFGLFFIYVAADNKPIGTAVVFAVILVWPA